MNSTLHKGIRDLCCEHGHLMHVRFHIPSGPYERAFCSIWSPYYNPGFFILGVRELRGSVLGLFALVGSGTNVSIFMMGTRN